MRRLHTLVLTGLAVAALAACGSSSIDSASESGVDSVVTTIGTPADVSARIIGDGSSFSLQAAVVESPVAFWFWAPG
jgi:ABC-type phosphate transport system substrate-binding protein